MSKIIHCKTHYIHEKDVTQVLRSMPAEENLYDLADFFKLFGDTTRMKILHALSILEMCVCDLSEVLKVSQSAISHQLKTLRQANLVKFRKDKKSVFYSLKDEHVNQIIALGLQHINEK
jgi:ArsR family transcriptional regulator